MSEDAHNSTNTCDVSGATIPNHTAFKDVIKLIPYLSYEEVKAIRSRLYWVEDAFEKKFEKKMAARIKELEAQ